MPTPASNRPSVHGNDGLVLLLAPQADEGAEGEEIDREEFRRPELSAKEAMPARGK